VRAASGSGEDAAVGVTDDEPLVAWPVRVTAVDGGVVARGDGAPVLDLAPVRDFWRAWFRGLGGWPGEDIYYGLMERFLGTVHVEDPDAFAALAGSSVLYLGNHQVGIESLLFSVAVSALGAQPALALAKAEHRHTWLGDLIRAVFSYPGVDDPGLMVYFDRDDRESLPAVLAVLAERLTTGRRSVLVHVEGTRALAARSPVAKMSGAFIDLALATSVPIVPVRFAGALPVEPLAERREFPVGMGRQSYYLGRPLHPAELRALGYKERKERVVAAINSLGPPLAAEEPAAAAAALEASVLATAARHGVAETHAVVIEMLRGAAPSVDGRALLDAVEGRTYAASSPARQAWVARFAAWLRGGASPG
jgi:1-acyl-sn-glycerol-3-phosphate acyltransferase